MKFFIFVNRVFEEEEKKKLLFILLLLFISELATQIFKFIFQTCKSHS